MPAMEIVHDTFTLESAYASPPKTTFAAFAESTRKRRWYAHSETFDTLEYRLDFAVGGQEVLIARLAANTPIAGAVLNWTSTYSEIKTDNRIVFSQTVDMNEFRISCALVTVEFMPQDSGCLVRLTHQAAFFEGSDGPAMRKIGWRALLATLGTELHGS